MNEITSIYITRYTSRVFRTLLILRIDVSEWISIEFMNDY